MGIDLFYLNFHTGSEKYYWQAGFWTKAKPNHQLGDKKKEVLSSIVCGRDNVTKKESQLVDA